MEILYLMQIMQSTPIGMPAVWKSAPARRSTCQDIEGQDLEVRGTLSGCSVQLREAWW